VDEGQDKGPEEPMNEAMAESAATVDEAAPPLGDGPKEKGGEGAGKDRKSGRPLGISKIDLRTVWGSRTPAGAPEAQAGMWPSDYAAPIGYMPCGRMVLQTLF